MRNVGYSTFGQKTLEWSTIIHRFAKTDGFGNPEIKDGMKREDHFRTLLSTFNNLMPERHLWAGDSQQSSTTGTGGLGHLGGFDVNSGGVGRKGGALCAGAFCVGFLGHYAAFPPRTEVYSQEERGLFLLREPNHLQQRE